MASSSNRIVRLEQINDGTGDGVVRNFDRNEMVSEESCSVRSVQTRHFLLWSRFHGLLVGS